MCVCLVSVQSNDGIENLAQPQRLTALYPHPCASPSTAAVVQCPTSVPPQRHLATGQQGGCSPSAPATPSPRGGWGPDRTQEQNHHSQEICCCTQAQTR